MKPRHPWGSLGMVELYRLMLNQATRQSNENNAEGYLVSPAEQDPDFTHERIRKHE
jgi:hypothetical protein